MVGEMEEFTQKLDYSFCEIDRTTCSVSNFHKHTLNEHGNGRAKITSYNK